MLLRGSRWGLQTDESQALDYEIDDIVWPIESYLLSGSKILFSPKVLSPRLVYLLKELLR